MSKNKTEAWWARQGLNLRPLRCEHSAVARKSLFSAISDHARTRTPREHRPISPGFYRAFAAPALTEINRINSEGE